MSQRITHRPDGLSAQAAELSIRSAELFAAAGTLQARAEALGERVRLFYEIVALTREVYETRLYEAAETLARIRPELLEIADDVDHQVRRAAVGQDGEGGEVAGGA